MNACDDSVTLTGGLTVPLLALQVLWGLENRGVSLTVDGDSLIVNPRQLITDVDRVAIRQLKRHLIALVGYEAVPGVQ
jgi:hypothetical protein